MNKATINGRVYLVPGALNELSAPQLLRLAGLIHAPNTQDEIVTKAIIILLNVWRNFYLTYLFVWHVTADHLAELARLTNFLFSDNLLTKNLLPTVRLPWRLKKYYGPADELENITFIEFIKAEAAFLAFQRTQKEEYLNRLCAILYRPRRRGKLTPENATGDIREKFNDALVPGRALAMARLPIQVRLAILLFFSGCRQTIVKANPEIFPEKKQTRTLSSELGWAGILRTLAGHINQFEKTGDQNLYTVLFDMKAAILEAWEREAKLNQP
ncbi:MAG: hypothetical protein ACO1OF_16495 [Adhaeribacter sp.]